MKRLLQFLKDNNGVLYYDVDHDGFVLATNQNIKLEDPTVHCPFRGCNANGIIPDKAGPEWIDPSIDAIERFGPE